MRKRLICFTFVILLVFTSFLGVRGASAICFVGLNDSVPKYLSAAEAPYYKSGSLYIPYTVFQIGPGGVAVSYNADKGSLALFTRTKRLVYDINSGTITDENEKVSKVEVAFRSGVLFIPATKALSHFGLSHTMLTSTSGAPVLRITDGSQNLDNSTFIRKAETLISIILEQEQGRETDETQQTELEREEEVPTGPVTVYMAFVGESVSQQTLDLLNDMSQRAAFFLTKEQIEQNNGLVREIYASGHRIGLTVERDCPDIPAALREANEALDQAAFFKTLMVLLPGNSQEMPQYAVFREWAAQNSVDEVLKSSETAHMLVCRNDAVFALQQLQQEGAYMPLLLETTQIPGVSTK